MKYLLLFLINITSLFVFDHSSFASDNKTIYIVQEAWHTGIVLHTRKVSVQEWPEISKYQNKQYIDISWGDEVYYQHPSFNLWLALRAVCFPTRSVIALNNFKRSIPSYYPHSRIMKINITHPHLQALCRFIAQSFQRDNQNQIIPSTLHDTSSIFFRGKRSYHLFRTCNTWVALALEKAGLPINATLALTADQLFNRLEKLKNAHYVQK